MSDFTDVLTDVDGVGEATAETIVEAFDDVDELRGVVTDLPDGYAPASLSRLDGFGPSRARRIATQIDESGVLEEVADE